MNTSTLNQLGIRRYQHSDAVSKVKAVSATRLQSGSQNKSFEKSPQQEKEKSFSEILKENLNS